MSDLLNNLISDFSIQPLKQFFRIKISAFKPLEEDFEFLFENDKNTLADFQDFIKIGEIEFDGNEDLIVFTTKSKIQLTIKSSKKKQFEIAKKILKEENRDAVIFIFYDELGNFRFSLIRANYLGIKRDFTDFKRYTYFVSKELTNRTFINQISNCNFNSLDEILEAFSVEPLNKLFYEKIKDSFYNLIGGKVDKKTYEKVLRLPSLDSEANRKIYQEFAVRLIGRIIFVWFLKNKTSAKNIPLIPKSWLNSANVKQNQNFYHTYLEKLFFEILNKKLEHRIENLPKEHKQVPFLNGGLFEPQEDDFYGVGSLEGFNFQNALEVPDSWILNLFETLEQFNFTIDENSLNDQEVSIDPEMLGTIFENLLAEIDPETEKSARNSTGSFYTPREIVDFMVEESLVSYLKNKTEINEEKLHNLFTENDFPESYFEEKEKLIYAFNEIKILDPACGSGAFPMGALHKIILALQKLDPKAEIWKKLQLEKIPNALVRKEIKTKLDNTKNLDYIRKLGVIQHSIFGVDIQPIATEISKLRCFLTLVVDEDINEEIENRGIVPLPNLEFKFVTANALIGLEKPVKVLDLFSVKEQNLQKLEELREEYLQSYGNEKLELKNEFRKTQKEIFQEELKNIVSGKQNRRTIQLANWNPFSHEKTDWFDSKMMFGVGDFDLVIGNPPYIQLEKAFDKDKKFADLYKNEKFQTFERKGNIYSLFYEKGMNLLGKNGLLCFITSNTWMRTTYGKSLRNFLAVKNPLTLLDLGPGVFKKATVDTNILLVENSNPQNNLKSRTLKKQDKINYLQEEDFTILSKLTEESWIILSPAEQKIKEKIEKIGTPLKDWDVKISYGIKTGFNDAFIIGGKTKDRLIQQDPKSAEIIKPILRGRDIKRYKAEFADKWLINSHNGYKDKNGNRIKPINIFEFPAIKIHLDNFWEKIEKRSDKGITPYNLRNCAYLEEFEKEKIVYKEISENMNATLLPCNFYVNNKCNYSAGIKKIE